MNPNPVTKSTVEIKRDILRDMFVPHELAWMYDGILTCPIGKTVECRPYPMGFAIRERFDQAFGADRWREKISGMNDAAVSVIECQYEDGKEWVSHVGVCSNGLDTQSGYDTAFRRAAYAFGIARYLRHHIQVVEVVSDDASPIRKCLKNWPQVPQHLLPHDYQLVARETARKLRDLVEQASKEAAATGEKIDPNEAASRLVVKYGIRPDQKGDVDFSRLTNVECQEAMQRTHDWIKKIVAKRVRVA